MAAAGSSNTSTSLILFGILLFGSLFAFCIANEEASKVGRTVIWIDLGTTYSCVGVYKDNRVEIIANDQGNRITPSWVAFTDSERLIGEASKNQAASNPERTIFDVKRLIGRNYSILCKAAYVILKAESQAGCFAVHWADALEAGIAAVSKYGGAGEFQGCGGVRVNCC